MIAWLALTAASVAPPISDDPVPVNLDHDPAPEQLLYHEPRSGIVQAQVRDRCHGTVRTWHLSPYVEKFEVIRATELDGATPQPEVLLLATGQRRRQFLEVVRFDQRRGRCSRPRDLLRYETPPLRECKESTVIRAVRLTKAAAAAPATDSTSPCIC